MESNQEITGLEGSSELSFVSSMLEELFFLFLCLEKNSFPASFFSQKVAFLIGTYRNKETAEVIFGMI